MYTSPGGQFRRRPRQRRHARPRRAVVPRRRRDRTVLQPVHPRRQPDQSGRRARGALPADRRPRDHTRPHGGAGQPADHRRARRGSRARRRLDVRDCHLDQRCACPGRARDVVARQRAGVVRGAHQRRRDRHGHRLGDRRRRGGRPCRRRDLPAAGEHGRLRRHGARDGRVRGRRLGLANVPAAAEQPPQRGDRRRVPGGGRPPLRRDRRSDRRAAGAAGRRARDLRQRGRRRLGGGQQRAGHAADRPAAGARARGERAARGRTAGLDDARGAGGRPRGAGDRWRSRTSSPTIRRPPPRSTRTRTAIR